MSYVFCNPNPYGRILAIDCTVRAITIAEDTEWYDIYFPLAVEGGVLGNMPSGNDVWQSFLKRRGYRKRPLPNTCPDCYTVKDFCNDHPQGTYILGTGSHVIAVVDGDYYDTWDSGDENPVFYYTKGGD